MSSPSTLLPAPPPSRVRVRRLDNGRERVVEPTELLWAIPCQKPKVKMLMMRERPLRGDVPYLRVSERWAVRVQPVEAPEAPPEPSLLTLAFRRFLASRPSGHVVEVG